MEELAPGFRFYPTEEELVSFYLHHKLDGKRDDLNRAMDRVIPVINIYEFNPSQLPQLSGELCRGDPEQWFYFIQRQESEANGGRPKRVTNSGYWKSTGSPSYVYSSNNRCVGMKRTMVFYIGRVPHGRKTEWKINEYKAIQLTQPQASSSSSTASLPTPMLRQEFSLCRLYKKSKIIRAFDRRPGGAMGEQRAPAPQIHGGQAIETNHHPYHKNLPVMAASENKGYSNTCQSGELLGDSVDEPLWEWEDLCNWYHCEEGMHAL